MDFILRVFDDILLVFSAHLNELTQLGLLSPHLQPATISSFWQICRYLLYHTHSMPSQKYPLLFSSTQCMDLLV
ncbi:hypothetical protein ACB092_11G001300 [Castanea dentata]